MALFHTLQSRHLCCTKRKAILEERYNNIDRLCDCSVIQELHFNLCSKDASHVFVRMPSAESLLWRDRGLPMWRAVLYNTVCTTSDTSVSSAAPQVFHRLLLSKCLHMQGAPAPMVLTAHPELSMN